jgi:thymidylate kinase
LKADQELNRTSKLKPYHYLNIPKDPLALKHHKLDPLCVWAAFLSHPHLNVPEENIILKQHEIDTIYSFLQDNKVILYTLNYSLSSRPYSMEKRRIIRDLVESNESFAETYEFAFLLKQETLKIMKTLTENDIEIIFIKSLAEIPLDSNNFDILVKKQDVMKAKKILEKLGFTEIRKLREYAWGGPPHKFLYRRLYNGLVMSIHLHTEVAWEGVKFVDEKELWSRICKTKIDGVKLGFPSPENHLLITVAHAFFENKCFKLSDLVFIVEDFKYGDEMDWDYIADCTIDGGWFEPFYATLRLADYIHESLFGRKLIEKDIFRKLAQQGSLLSESSLEKKLIDLFDRGRIIPIKLPNSRVIIAFIKKVFATPHFSFIEKSGQIFSTSRSYMKRRLKRRVPVSLVCFSGQDGTGKTKHSKLLQKELAQRNIQTDYVWSRGIGLSIEPFLQLGRLLLLGSKLSRSNEYVSKRRTLLKREPIKTLWTYIMLADEILLSLVKVRIPLLLGRVVICDRYILDILIDVKCELRKDVSWVIAECAKKSAPKPKIHFVLDAEPEEIMGRKKDLGLQLAKCKRHRYLAHSDRENLTLIDTERSLEQNSLEILSSFMKALYIGKN